MVRRALLVGQDDARGLLTAGRSLAARGWEVGAAVPGRRSMVAVSRHTSRWHPLDDDIVGSVAGAVETGGYDVVLPGGDQELFELSEGRERIPCVVPYGTKDSVRSILDKVSLAERAAGHGLDVPATEPATEEGLSAVSETTVLKSRSHAEGRSDTLISEDPEELREAAEEMRSAGAEPVLQEHATGALVALTLVIGPDGTVRAEVQQRASALWPVDAGITVRARTEPVDLELRDRLLAFLDDLGWQGLVEAQFLHTAAGYRLIDMNGRCYGSIGLAAAAGVHLAETWAASALGGPDKADPARVGTRYQWLYGDLRRAWRTDRDLVSPLRFARGAAHSVLDLRDPLPALAYLRLLAGSAVRK